MYELARKSIRNLISEVRKIRPDISFECLFDDVDESILVNHNYKDYENDEEFLQKLVELIDNLFYDNGFYEISISFDKGLLISAEEYSFEELEYPVKKKKVFSGINYAQFGFIDCNAA